VFVKSLYVRNRALTSTSELLKFQCQQTVNFPTYPKLNKWKNSIVNGNSMNIKVRSGLSQNKGLQRSFGPHASSLDKWDKTLVDMYSGEDRGDYKGEFDSEIIYLSGFSSGILEDLNSWIEDLQIFIEEMVDFATGSQINTQRFSEWLSRDLTPFIDAEHEDSLGIYVPLDRPRTFSFSGPTLSASDGITETAPAYLLFPEHFIAQFPRFKSRILFSCQAINLESEVHFNASGNIGAIRGFPADQYNGGALTSAIFNLISQHIQGTTSSNTWILLKIVQTNRRSREVFGIIKSSADTVQRTLDRKALNLEMSSPTLFHMPPLLMLLAPDMASARNAASSLILPNVLQAIRIEHWPRGQDVREMMRMLVQDSRADSLQTVKMIWVHREMMTTPAAITHSPGDTLYLFIPEGHRPEGIFCGEAVNFGRGRTREILGPDPIQAYSALRKQLQEDQNTKLSGDRPNKPAGTTRTGNAGRVSDRSGGRGRTNVLSRPALTPATAGGFTLVKSKATIRSEKKPAIWGGQAVALPTLLGIPSLANPKSKLRFAPPPPPRFPVTIGIRADLSHAEYPVLDSKLKPSDVKIIAPQWIILQYPQEGLGIAKDKAEPELEEDGIIAPGLLGRCLSLGITDTVGACMAYWAARTQILLLTDLYPTWPKPTIPISMEFLLETKLLAPKLSGEQKIIRLGPIEESDAAMCAVWGANNPSQIKAVLTVLQEQYSALRIHWTSMATSQGVQPAQMPVDYTPHMLRLSGTELLSLLTGALPVKPASLLAPEDRQLGDALGVPAQLQQSLRILIYFLMADTIRAGFPPGGMRSDNIKFQHEEIPWTELEIGLPQVYRWVLTPQTQQHLKAFKAYNAEAQATLLRALIWVERAVHWSRLQDGLESRGSYLYPACLAQSLSATSDSVSTSNIEYPGLQELCSQQDLPLEDIQTSISSFPGTWSELGSIVTNWVTQPELLPWSVENNPPLLTLLQAADLENDAAEIYGSMVSQPTLWSEAMKQHTDKISWSRIIEYGPTPSEEHKDILRHYLGELDNNMINFILSTMVNRAAHWRRAIIAIEEFNRIPASKEIVRTLPSLLLHYVWSLGAHKLKSINTFLLFMLKQVEPLTIILDLISRGTQVLIAPMLTDSALKFGGSLPPEEYFCYLPPSPFHNDNRSEDSGLQGHTSMSNE